MEIKQVVVWETSDGEKHLSLEMANAYVANNKLRDDMATSMEAYGKIGGDAQDVLNWLSGRRPQVRAWLDACDAKERTVLK